MKKPFTLLAVLATFAALIATAPIVPMHVAVAATAPPTPPVLPAFSPAPVVVPNATATPVPNAAAPLPQGSPNSATATFPGHKAGAEASPAPPVDKRKGIEGVWEVQIQRGDKTMYTHFKLKQDANALTGVYLDADNKQHPLAGSLDGKSVRIVVTMADGSSMTFTAQLDGTTDMLGMLTSTSESTPFTAAYRPKENFLDNISASPGGMGGPSSGGGYNPP